MSARNTPPPSSSCTLPAAMISLTSENVRLRVSAKTKEEAIRAAGQVLVESGCIEPGYVESMLGRERQANTYLSHGIAIPHGMPQDRELIKKTSVCVVQIPEGVTWNDGSTAHLVVGIAAKSDEHLGVLAALTDVLDDPAAAQRLSTTTQVSDIVDALNRQQPKGVATQELVDGEQIEVAIIGEAGLHARPATTFASVAGEFESNVRVKFGGKVANGKAMASLLKLGVPGGGRMVIQASGSDQTEALQALRDAVAAGLDDLPDEHATTPAANAQVWTPASQGRSIAGVCASPGLAVGRLHIFQATVLQVVEQGRGEELERRELAGALEAAELQLEEIYDAVSARSGKGNAAIFRAHQAMIQDDELLSEVKLRIETGKSAAWAWQTGIERRVVEMRGIADEHIAARAVDLHDVGQRVLRLLAGAEHAEATLPDEPVILVSDDLTPSDTAKLDPRKVLGLCTASGGPTSHTAIIARSLDIPAVVGAGPAVLEQKAGLTCVLDGSAGLFYVEPSQEDLESAKAFQQDLRVRRDVENENRYKPAILTDGHRVEVVANIGKVAEAAAAVEAGAEGIGLLRTEFFFLDRAAPPTEEEQYQAYTEMVRALNGLPLIIRTLDIGGDKALPYLTLPEEENPFLGVRGIRLCLRRPDLFIPQLRAIYRAAQHGPVKIMFPMIATLEDFHAAREAAEKVRAELGVAPVEMGIMVEVPSTVLMAVEFAKEVDFFSIGTNDLTQYTLAMDRLHPALAKHVDGLHPAVLRLIDLTVKAATQEGKWVGVCGGVAGDPLGASILTGLGVSELSMSLPSVAAVKSRLRELSLPAAKNLARMALKCSTAEQVRALQPA
ncbi:phosphoenolpyruvate--protein phosphotransferase [Roseimicrobium sp. ORNL1]|uniref:phosphoenolpyruvate--protein phosphotransferase n=1 Tax=Roseimicrobium sp. ORNL1 TaxID=2711231 RepID=UPI0019818EB0|nr:phosphoenolpyruvate--protein phosphotransferase [Roseimicrobium sp. ORNL1]